MLDRPNTEYTKLPKAGSGTGTNASITAFSLPANNWRALKVTATFQPSVTASSGQVSNTKRGLTLKVTVDPSMLNTCSLEVFKSAVSGVPSLPLDMFTKRFCPALTAARTSAGIGT